MRKIYLSLLSILLVSIYAAAQTLVPLSAPGQRPGKTPSKPPVQADRGGANPQRPERCGFNYIMNEARAKGFNDAMFESQLATLIEKKLANRVTDFTGPVTIPVIFHVIYRNADALGNNSANLSSARFQAQIDQLNLDYANLSGSIYGVAADVQLRFCLALVDTAGRALADPGIDRINGQSRGWANTNTQSQTNLINNFENTIKPGSIWDPYSYLNVWTAGMNNSGLLGYATFPGLSTLAGLNSSETDNNAGVVIAWQSVGSVANPNTAGAPYDLGRTLTHEAGHYLGLRHIWGDSFCGNDYCGDTPPQDDATSGCPTHPAANNCTPAGPKMFQNYMDYSNDACLNTFTSNQAIRCQTVMDNAIRRKELLNSRACVARAGNTIGFTKQAAVTAETGSTGTCPVTKTFQVQLAVASAATNSATVTFTLGGDAVNNSDYTISPSSVTYTNGDNALKTLTITILDDKVAEATERIVIGYSISGSGVAAGPEKQTFTLYISDDDYNRSININAPVTTLLSENFQASTNIPAGWTTETLGYAAGTPNQWVVSANGGSTFGASNVAHITQNTGTKVNTYNVSMESDAYLISPLIDATGLSNLNITFNWRAIGETNFDEGYIGYIPEGQSPTADNVLFFNTVFRGQTNVQNANLNLPASMSGTKFYFVFNWYNDASGGSSPGFTIDNIVLTGRSLGVATAAASSMTTSQNASSTVQYISGTSPNEVIIARVANLNQNVGCITSSVQAAGNGRTAIITSGGNGFRSNKVIRITPAVANTTASYQVTLYFTTAEMTGWLPGEIAGLQIMKLINDAYTDNTYATSDGHVIPTTFSDQSANGYYAYTGTVTDGFSDFMLVSSNIVLPVELLTFEATAQKSSILLNWSTSQEFNNKGFVIERSTNGTNYERISWVDGAGTNSNRSDYTFTDNFVNPGVLYYYRLRQTDMDAREKLSDIRQAKITRSGILITVSPNPAKDLVSVFVSGGKQPADIELLNTQGQVVKSWKQVNAFASPSSLSISGLPAGVYVLNILLPEERISRKLVIE